MNEALLREIADRTAISGVLHRYCRGVDSKNWALLEGCFADDLEADFRSFAGREVVRGRAAWLAAMRKTIAGLDATQHLTGNHEIAIAGDAATLRADLQAVHILRNDRGDAEYTVGGFYDIDLGRASDGWRIRRYRLTVVWTRGNRDVLRLAAKRSG
jgi:hypothetical protein